MKKLIALLLFSGLALTACSSNKTDANSSSSSKEKTEQTATSSSSEKDQKKIEEEQKKLEQLRKDFNDAMTNENAVFHSSQMKWLKTKQRLKSQQLKAISL